MQANLRRDKIQRIVHMSIHVSLLRQLKDADLIETFKSARVNGKQPTAQEIRTHLTEQEAEGRYLWNSCRSTHPDGSCACAEVEFGE